MLFVSHIYTASRLKKSLKVTNSNKYYLASVLPDIRYITDLERKRTHVRLGDLKKYFKTDSDLYKGYYLHLFIDEYMGQWQFHEKLRAQYPALLRPFLKSLLLNMILEIYVREHLDKWGKIKLDSTFYLEYKKFGMKPQDVRNYASYIQAMLDNFSVETATKVILSDPKLSDNKKVAKYKKIGAFILNVAPLKWYLLSKAHLIYERFVEDLEKQMTSHTCEPRGLL